MNMNVYTVLNKNSTLCEGLFLFKTDQHAVFEMSRRVPRDKLEHNCLLCVGTMDIETGELNGFEIDDIYPIEFQPVSVDDLATPAKVRKGTPQEVEHDWVVNNH